MLWTTLAHAFDVEVPHGTPSLAGESHTFSATVTGATGEVTFAWRFGDAGEVVAGGAEMANVFAEAGHYSVDVVATDETGETGSAFFRHLVHHPLTPLPPSMSSSIIYDGARNRVYTTNPDSNTVAVIDPDTLSKLGEFFVYENPESLALTPDGKLWVLHREDYAIAVVDPDQLLVESGFRLPYASQPIAVAQSPTGDAAYVSLMALGKLLKLNPNTGEVLGEVEVGPKPRGIAVSHDGLEVYVTRFISADTGGEVVKVATANMTVAARVELRVDSETVDSDLQARGVPNYLFSVALTPDGRQAWVPGKQDNILRGLLRDGQDLTHDTTVRPLTSIIDIASASEIFESRIDLDDRSMPVHAEFTPYGNFAILSLAGSNRIEIRDVFQPKQVFSAIGDAGVFPRATVLTPNKRLFVQATLSRSVLAYDMSALLDDYDQSTPALLAEIPTVTYETLPPQVLDGKRLFHDAEDTRIAFEGYMSCGACHFEGLDDGRVYDFSSSGEGLRNTVALLGRSAAPQGRLNWSGNFDELQDLEHTIRDLFRGTGLLSDEVLGEGTRSDPLGDTKAGLSAELDALAAYVASLDHVNPSPYKDADGTLTAEGEAGKLVFQRLGCDFCHAGPAFTDSDRGSLHDVGTLTPLSGTRAGQPLFGIDTPTLLGVWETAPYLHDGSAPTLRDVITSKNPDDLHGFVSILTPAEVDQLVAYMLQIDGDPPLRRLPFEPPLEPGTDGSGGSSGSDGSTGTDGMAGATTTTSPPPAEDAAADGCSCTVVSPSRSRTLGAAYSLVLAGLLAGAARRRRSRGEPRARCAGGRERSARLKYPLFARALLLLVAGTLGACSSGDPEESTPGGPVDWSALPAVVKPDAELAPLGERLESYQQLCARGRSDSFATALCASGSPPRLENFSDLLDLVNLGSPETRAFALTGNSTSLVARSVSAVNPRIIVFPRVGSDLTPPDSMTAVGFVRGEQFVELVSRDPVTANLNFYLLSFEQACSYDANGCDLASLLTESIERDWTAYSVYDHEDLEATSFDCLSCHEPGGPGSKRILRMQELESPWLHWFPQRLGQRTESDRVLLAQFGEAHAFESQYGGIPLNTILNALDEGSGAQLEALVRAEGFAEQPNPFDAQIALETKAGESPTWEARFEAHRRGEAIAVPYPNIDVTDSAKRAAAISTYANVVQGLAARETLLDLRDVFSDDAASRLSFVPWPGSDGRSVLLQMCARCHDGRGNPELAKNQFNVLALDQMSREVKDRAIARVTATGPRQMPPPRVGTLSPEAIDAVVLELQR